MHENGNRSSLPRLEQAIWKDIRVTSDVLDSIDHAIKVILSNPRLTLSPEERAKLTERASKLRDPFYVQTSINRRAAAPARAYLRVQLEPILAALSLASRTAESNLGAALSDPPPNEEQAIAAKRACLIARADECRRLADQASDRKAAERLERRAQSYLARAEALPAVAVAA